MIDEDGFVARIARTVFDELIVTDHQTIDISAGRIARVSVRLNSLAYFREVTSVSYFKDIAIQCRIVAANNRTA